MNRFKKRSGLTLLEIVISIAILAIIFVAFTNAFTYGLTNLLFSGQKSSELMELQSVVDELNTTSFYAKQEVVDFLTNKGYLQCDPIDQITVSNGNDTNFYVSSRNAKAGTNGYDVTILMFTDNEKRQARVSTFVLYRGDPDAPAD